MCIRDSRQPLIAAGVCSGLVLEVRAGDLHRGVGGHQLVKCGDPVAGTDLPTVFGVVGEILRVQKAVLIADQPVALQDGGIDVYKRQAYIWSSAA